ncbi:FAD-dependent monooxygenase [Pseudoalteromonas xiamenensis]|uniref:FAD-dependent monooxygenase n=1 Tax=Pseudoalteromonas xiamenensis TaxID=882626 RepID=UPI0027E51598|nr:FAD-dependent monooxygenase [Pseudoalteromonas xiamenensis]WMN59609.1 FAD-dependent monooxygenase [Pseudoalteromonas xiamenensis]
MTGIIIGAGIGGLSSAIALQAKNIDVEVFDATPLLTVVGAGILLPPNAMAVLEQYQLADQIESIGYPVHSFSILDYKGKSITRSSSCYQVANREYHTIALHRGVLQQVLLNAFGKEKVHTGHECVRVKVASEGVGVDFNNSVSKRGDFLIGADGIHSVIRKQLFPSSALRYSGQRCWRGIANFSLSSKWLNQFTEIWGNGSRFGFVQISNDQVYWYATLYQKNVNITDSECPSDILLREFCHYCAPVLELIRHTPPEALIDSFLHDLSPLAQWYQKSIVLIGDAAHAMTPNLGQGGAQAIEDSFVLAEQLAQYESPAKAFQQFQTVRFKKVRQVVSLSWQIGKATNLSNPWVCAARNRLVRQFSPISGGTALQNFYKWP